MFRRAKIMVKWLILCGNEENWNVAIKNKVWGTKPLLRKLWSGLSKGDIIFFYVTRSIKRIVGVGIVKEKLDPQTYEPKPLWPDEKNKDKVIYPYRFRFETIYLCKNLSLEGINIKGLKISRIKGMSRILDKQSTLELHRLISTNWNVDIPLPEDVVLSLN